MRKKQLLTIHVLAFFLMVTSSHAANLDQSHFCETWLLSIQQNADRILNSRGNGTTEKTINPWPEALRKRGIEPRHPETIEVKGIPDFVKPLDSLQKQGKIFRQFVQSPEAWQIIQHSKELKAGPRVFELAAPGVWIKRYLDLSGVFLTIPGAWPSTVGLGASESIPYIDVILDQNIPVLELNAMTQIYMIPSGPNAVPVTILNTGILKLR